MIMDGGFTPYTADGIAGPEDPVVEVESRGRQPVRPSQFESCNMADESASTPWHSILDLNYTLRVQQAPVPQHAAQLGRRCVRGEPALARRGPRPVEHRAEVYVRDGWSDRVDGGYVLPE
jgi:hypothetical protein